MPNFNQLSLFETTPIEKEKTNLFLSKDFIERFKSYNINFYIEDLKKYGLESLWDLICNFLLKYGENQFLKVDSFGELYEIGLAEQNKENKKANGQYYTPTDVALVMSKWLKETPGENVCDVACGTGKLILTYLDLIGKENAIKLISEGKLYLYDFDKTALLICKTALLLKYGVEFKTKIHAVYGDFLSSNIKLPKNSKTISNPPYAQIENAPNNWTITKVIEDTSELYSAFMEKIFDQSDSTVIITPYSFMGGAKFYSLRKLMCQNSGFIVSFDNVPGNIFCGRKHGIFNTNTSNSVRAAITVVRKDQSEKGFKVTPFIRFKNEEREELLNNSLLEGLLTKKPQIIDENHKSFEKYSYKMERILNNWKEKSSFCFKDLVAKTATNYSLEMPNTCRYYTVASVRHLNRTGCNTFYFNNEEELHFVYCLINSSFTYWWWRIYDGGITYPKSILETMPVPFNLLDDKTKKFFKEVFLEMVSKEKDSISIKMNAGKPQENLKIKEEYRIKINNKLLDILQTGENFSIFNEVHSNKFFMGDMGNGKHRKFRKDLSKK